MVPGINDVADFDDAICGANCNAIINSIISVRGIKTSSTYTGTITQSSGVTITLGSKGFRQSGGTFIGGNSTILVNGTFSVTGGTFTSTSEILHTRSTVSRTATFNHNNGTWRIGAPWTSSRGITFGTLTLNNLEFYIENSYDDYTLTLSGTVSLAGNLSYSYVNGSNQSVINNGTINVTHLKQVR